MQVVLARNAQDELVHTGVYVGDDLETYLQAARQSREQNITVFDEPVAKIVCVMQGDEFFSTWVANKAVYRTRMALADGGELVDHRARAEAVRRAARSRRASFASTATSARRA